MDFVTFLSLVVAKKVTARASNYEVGSSRRRGEEGGRRRLNDWHIPNLVSCGAHVVAICNLVARIGCRFSRFSRSHAECQSQSNYGSNDAAAASHYGTPAAMICHANVISKHSDMF